MIKPDLKTKYENECLDGQDFSELALLGITFRNCSLRRCSFKNADLSYTEFEDCDLYEADFTGACLYVTRFVSCDATKSVLKDAFLHGFRSQETDITHVELDDDLKVGKNRKRTTNFECLKNAISVGVGTPIPNLTDLEDKFSGIICQETGVSIEFKSEEKAEAWRRFRRQSEIAKNLERLMHENGYRDQALNVYFLKRKFRTRAETNISKRALLLLQEAVWGYGVSIYRPIFSALLTVCLFSILYMTLPYISASSGLAKNGHLMLVVPCDSISWSTAQEILTFTIQVATLSVYSELKPIGIAEVISAAHSVLSVAMVGLIVAALTRRIGNV